MLNSLDTYVSECILTPLISYVQLAQHFSNENFKVYIIMGSQVGAGLVM